MIDVIRSNSRGAADHGWLKARHTFSFADYHNPSMMGFGPLRVINEDRIEPGKGFGTHPHKDMEIVTYIIAGALKHQDSMGNGSVIEAGDIQRMSAGTGVFHSEVNPSAEDPVHLLQIWILPREASLQPGYEQQHFSREEKLNNWRLVVSKDGRESSMLIRQAVDLYTSVLETGVELHHAIAPGHSAFLQIVSGCITVNDQRLEAGDGAAIQDVDSLTVVAAGDAEAILFDMS